ncbi:MAG: hypothetical protein LQ346_009059 [Caloplaca aetnensis]|nr:MAG: hypothetical protein LQ346_009059 [Caloplaca aetnensis]
MLGARFKQRGSCRSEDIDVKAVGNNDTMPAEVDPHLYSLGLTMTAAAATQMHQYMLESGCAYGCVVTGEYLVFLPVKEDDPNILWYHLAEPLRDVISGPGGRFQHSQTAIAQLTSFCLMATEAKKRNQEWITKAMEEAHTWQMDEEKVWVEIPRKMRELDRQDISCLEPRVAIKTLTK